MTITNTHETNTILPVEAVGGTLVEGGMSEVYTVKFIKEDLSLRTITGVLVKPIDGPLGTNVALMTDDGYKSFNTGRVVSITKESN